MSLPIVSGAWLLPVRRTFYKLGFILFPVVVERGGVMITFQIGFIPTFCIPLIAVIIEMVKCF